MNCARCFVLSLFALLAVTTCRGASDSDAIDGQASGQPNILFIMSDDHTSQAIGAYQRRLAKVDPTPVLDQLAEGGMLLENSFCSNSICTPSRASVISGRYSHTTNTRDLDDSLSPEFHTLPRQLRAAGYQTAVIGKWHLTHEPVDFDHYCVLPGQGKYFDPFFQVRGETAWPDNLIQVKGKHSTDAITDLTLDWLANQRDADRPFFLMHHYKAPHDFFEYAPRYEDYLRDTDIPIPDSMWRQSAGFGSLATRGVNDQLLPHIGTSVTRRNPFRNYTHMYADDPSLSDRAAAVKAYQTYLKNYLRCVKGVDDNLGRLFDYLKRNDLFDNTIILYTSDQGMMLGEHDYIDKRWMFDESMRTPLIMHYPPAIPADVRTDAMIENIDLAPTLLDFADATIPPEVQGRSFRELCETGIEPEDWKQEAYYRYWMHVAHHDVPGHLGIRTKRYKLMFFYGMDFRDRGKPRTPPAWELYDLQSDPLELTNVVDDPDYADVVKDLKRRLAEKRELIGDTGSESAAVEAVIQQHWDDTPDDRAQARKISATYAKSRQGRRRYIPGENKHDK
ncbi:sulfatase [Crateriforma conspicua]|uniref:Arylsulfatase n=1 Tax=Crateriforma conspicua TaxID=2527996 RepID=A0A5C6FVU8_9PLAN|nr:sulfatase [Crateriforma conspicua]TWU67049.1 Arylsulfatase [Crateriforma conspicua]